MRRVLHIVFTLLVAGFGYAAWRFGREFSAEYSERQHLQHKVTRPGALMGIELRDVEIQLGGTAQARGWLVPSKNHAYVIFIHGSGSDRTGLAAIAQPLIAAGYGAILLDMPGHGESTGKAVWGASSQEAVKKAVDLAVSQPGTEHVSLYGFSMGSCIAAQVAASDTRVGALILAGPFTRLTEQMPFERQGRRWPMRDIGMLAARASGMDLDALNTLDALKRMQPRPLLIIGGTADTSIPVHMPKALFDAAREPKSLWMIERADHLNERDVAGHAVFDTKVREFLRDARAVNHAK
jgi:uncharacterized protein